MQANNATTQSAIAASAALLELIPGAALAYDGDSDSFYFNKLAAAWLGVEPSKGVFKYSELSFQVNKIDEQFPLRHDKTPWQRTWNREPIQDEEVVLNVPNQPPRFIVCNGQRVTATAQSAPVAIVTMVDISSIRADYQSLLDARTHMHVILEGTDAGTWKWNVQSGEAIFNERWAQMLGYSLKELQPTSIHTWINLTHPDDVKATKALLEPHFSGKTPHYNVLFRMQHKDGHWLWVQGRGRVYQWDAEGKPLWMAGTHLDISNIRAAEEETRSSNAYLKALIDSSSDVAIIATNTNGLVTIFNTGAEKLLGYTEDEMVGKLTPASFHLEAEVIARGLELSEEAGYAVEGFEVFVYAARHGRSETRKWTYVCKTGEHRIVSLSVSALRDGDNNVIGFLGMAVDQTAQLAAEEQARLSAQRFAGAFNSTAVGMALVSLEGRWMEVNDALCEMLDYNREALLKTDFQTLTHPDDLQNDLLLLNRLLADEIQNYDMQKRYYRKNGELIQAKLWVALVRDSNGRPLHFVSQIQNITDEYLARLALQSSEARLRGLFDLSPVGISLMDFKTGKHLEANEAMITPTGYSHKEFMTLTDRELTPLEYAPLMSTAIEQLRTAGRFTAFEKEYIRKDGSRYPILVQGILMKEPTGREVIWSLAEDISDRKRLDQIQNEFVSTVSHELRTPITSISGALSLIVGGVLGTINDDVRSMLEIAARSSERLTTLVNELLDMDKLQSGKMEFKIEYVDLLPLLEEAIGGIAVLAQAEGVTIVRTNNTPMQIKTDSTRLIQVITNLLSNACKHSARGGKVELIHVAGPEDSVILSVIDHGEGVPKKFRSRIFQKFAQADNTDAREKKGTGLGLTICKELVERMGGVIGYESDEGIGSHFWLKLPGARVRVGANEQLPRVLYVQSAPDFAKLLNLQVHNWLSLELAANLTDAKRKIVENRYDLILLDMNLADGSRQLLAEILLSYQPDVPIVILSGHEVPRMLANNIAAVLLKDDTTLTKILSTLHTIFELGDT